MNRTSAGGVMQHQFAVVPHADIPRSVFDRSCGRKQTLDAGYIVPFFLDEVLPGDTFTVDATIIARLATPIAPLMDNLYLDVFYFFCPTRILWDNFRKFMGEQANPNDSVAYSIPQLPAPTGGWLEHSLGDYLGLPIKVDGISVNALPFRMYNMCYREWFRDQNLINSPVVDLDDADGDPADYVLRKRGKRHDYFTSCLPDTQKGTAVSIPLGTYAPVVSDGQAVKFGKNANLDSPTEMDMRAAPYYFGVKNVGTWSVGDTAFYANQGMKADLASATSATINSLREAFQLQKLLERDMRGGTRYNEIVKSHFNVTFPDVRYRPEYLGGNTAPIHVTPVPQTSNTTGSYPQGHLAGFGTVITRSGFVKSFVEHGYIMGLCSVRADLTYQQGINRLFSRRTKYDFYWPALSNLGEQAVLNKEIFAQSVAAPGDANDLANEATFGYQERYAEYRYKPSEICGKMRSTATTPLDVWHLSQKFTSKPTLSQTFIEEAVPMDRVSAVVSEPALKMDSAISCHAARPMPVFSVPGLIDHF